MAVVLEVQGKLREAEAQLRRVNAQRTEILGPNDASLFESISRLGQVLIRQGRYEEAERLHRRLL